MKLSFLTTSCARAVIFAVTLLSITVSAFAADPDLRKYIASELFINNHRYGDSNGCSSDLPVTGRVSCGHAGHVSEVSWTYLRSTPEGDIYKITRKYPSDSDTAKTDTKEVTYSGQPLTLWSDDYQKIILRQKPAA